MKGKPLHDYALYLSLLGALLLCGSCNDDDSTEPDVKVEVPKGITFEAPDNFPAVHYDLQKNPVTNAGFELGRALFYEGKLSRDGSITCGSCHQQSAAFTHHGHIVSHGIDDKLGTRNATSIMNMAWQKDFFWDGGVHDLDLQPIVPIENPVEMDVNVSTVLDRLRADANYVSKFNVAFGSEVITTERFLKALSQFMVVLISSNSPYDRYVRGEVNALSSTELIGLKLFQQKCASCHSTDLFTDLSFRNNGLDEDMRTDKGRYNITLNKQDEFKFKVPSLRNAELTAPYMHDGRFSDLESVLNHYANDVHDNVNLDPLLKQNGQFGIPMSDDEKIKIIAFIKTLTDREFITDIRFSESSKN